jgi:hypothetical protein
VAGFTGQSCIQRRINQGLKNSSVQKQVRAYTTQHGRSSLPDQSALYPKGSEMAQAICKIYLGKPTNEQHDGLLTKAPEMNEMGLARVEACKSAVSGSCSE